MAAGMAEKLINASGSSRCRRDNAEVAAFRGDGRSPGTLVAQLYAERFACKAFRNAFRYFESVVPGMLRNVRNHRGSIRLILSAINYPFIISRKIRHRDVHPKSKKKAAEKFRRNAVRKRDSLSGRSVRFPAANTNAPCNHLEQRRI